MDEKRGKRETVILSSSSEEENYDDDSEQQFSDCDEPSESDDTDINDEEEEEDRDETTGSDDCDVDDESLSEKVVSLLQDGKDVDSLKLNECKAYLRKHGLRLAGNRAVCIARVKEHWRLIHESGYTLYPRSSFNINCTGDVCMGDVVLFKQKVYEKFSKMTRHGRVIGNRTVAGRVVKESYGAAKQQHTFTVEVLWSSGARKLPPLSPLLVKGRNLYKQKTYRQVSISFCKHLFYFFFSHPHVVAICCFYCYLSCFRDGKMKLIGSKCYLRSTDVVQKLGL
ncbi:hypothetical protein KIW84_024857 [Lathyrus oleraceus]|uniref:SAP domain-containing protein n=1 Tax=Pisum sativum TaxID=3888 RepID=A0A9D4YHI7_PEA|nr:hypothetical protein KIW84_024857 [Pisum sativum]